MINQSIHTIDLLYYLAGDVESVCAFADLAIHDRIEVEDNAVAILRFRNGALGVIEGSTSCYSPTGNPAEVHMCGSGGSVLSARIPWRILYLITNFREKPALYVFCIGSALPGVR